jgi:phosphatidylethanolamine N-methyltransferase
MISYIVWRLGYNAGLGFILYSQSNSKWFSQKFEQLINGVPDRKALFERNVSTKTGGQYKMENYPKDFNVWMAYRVLVDLILGTDLTTYLAFCIAHFEKPTSIGLLDIVLYAIGILLCVFNLWAKSDAHRVLGDYAWYWGDFFFLLDKNLIFDGIFQMFPHPMYTVGYAFYYGLSLITRSKEVLVVSFMGHMLQLLFLVSVENPHIEKIYGANYSLQQEQESLQSHLIEKGYTTGERKESILLFNMDLLRASDFVLLVSCIYIAFFTTSIESKLFHVLHVVFWRLFQSGFLGLILNAQSISQFYTRLYEKRGGNKQQAFKSWKNLYNFALTLNHIVFVTFALRMTFDNAFASGRGFFGLIRDVEWMSVLQIMAGVILIILNVWQSYSCYEVLGDFGWYYGDFFIEKKDIPVKLQYTGIYRYLNNPELVLGFAAYFGLALISHSWLVFGMSVFTQAVSWLFINLVEKPHMQKLYGTDQIRKDGGIVSELKSNKHIKRITSASKLDNLGHTVQSRIDELKSDLDTLQKRSVLFDPDEEFKLRNFLNETVQKLRHKLKNE